MVAERLPPSAAEPRAVRIQVRCGDEREFRERYAPWYAAEGIFLPGALPAPLGTRLPLTIELRDGRRVFSGIAQVDHELEEPAGVQLRVLRVDPGSAPLAPVLTPVGGPAKAAAPGTAGARLAETLFSDLPPPEEVVSSKPLVVRTSAVKLRLRPTPPRKP